MHDFLKQWGESAYTTTGFFWSALWAFALGYVISSMIQVFVTQQRMKKAMGKEGIREVGLATFFGFISSSCSFAALATTKSLFKKGAGFVPSIAFLLSSTNLVIELGIVITIFLSWQFVVGEYIGGLLLILVSWLFIRLTNPGKLIKEARNQMGSKESDADKKAPDWKKEIRSVEGWQKVGNRYVLEWNMVWKDVTFGFTVAGIIAAFVPDRFFQTLFIGVGSGQEGFSFLQVLEHTIVGPAAAFMTFIGSMGNIPLAALLYGNGVSFAGIMAFIFSDLIVFPVLRINAKYYGWKMSLFIAVMLLVALIISAITLHYGLTWLHLIPEAGGSSIQQRDPFKLNHTFFLNILFVIISGWMIWQGYRKQQKEKGNKEKHNMKMADKGILDKLLKWLALASFLWLGIGLTLKLFIL